jgi:hypothetical protein
VNYDKYDAIVVSDRYAHPYIFMAWKYKLSYKDFHRDVEFNSEPRSASSLIKRLGNVYFEEIDISKLPD